MSDLILYALLSVSAVSLTVIALTNIVYRAITARYARQMRDSTIEARALERLADEYEWKTALTTRRGIKPIAGKGKRHG